MNHSSKRDRDVPAARPSPTQPRVFQDQARNRAPAEHHWSYGLTSILTSLRRPFINTKPALFSAPIRELGMEDFVKPRLRFVGTAKTNKWTEGVTPRSQEGGRWTMRMKEKTSTEGMTPAP